MTGNARDMGRSLSWSLVLKVVPDPGGADDPTENNYWKREFRTYQAGLLADLPGIVAPRCFGALDRPGESTWLWLEDVAAAGQALWDAPDYGQAARHLARFNAAYLLERPRPEGVWLSERMLRKWCTFFAPYMRRLPQTLDHPLVRQVCPPQSATRLQRLWTAHAMMLHALERLPRTFCHFDAIQRNLYRRDGSTSAATVALDWEWTGIGAVGEDLAPLVAGSLCMCDAEATEARRLDTAAFAGYMDGLRDAGWRGDLAEVRLAYTAASALRYGLWAAWLASQLALEENGHTTVAAFFDRPVDAVVEHFTRLLPLLLDHADNARELL